MSIQRNLDKRDSETEEVVEYVRKQNARPRVQAKECPIAKEEGNPVDQGHKDNCDINKLVRRFAREGFPKNDGRGSYQDNTLVQGDLTEVIDRTKGIQERGEKAARKLMEKKQNAENNSSGSSKDSGSSGSKESGETAGKETPKEGGKGEGKGGEK